MRGWEGSSWRENEGCPGPAERCFHAGKGSCLPFGCLTFVGNLVLIKGYRSTDTFGYWEVPTLNSRVASELSCRASGSLLQPCHLAINHHHKSSNHPAIAFCIHPWKGCSFKSKHTPKGLLSTVPPLCSSKGFKISSNLNPTNPQSQPLLLQEGH